MGMTPINKGPITANLRSIASATPSVLLCSVVRLITARLWAMGKTVSCLVLILSVLLLNQHPVLAQSSLSENLGEDAALREATLIAVRSALGGRDNAAVVSRGGFFLDIKIYVETYRGVRDATTLANIQKRYSEAKSELLEPRLPDTIEELVSILATL